MAMNISSPQERRLSQNSRLIFPDESNEQLIQKGQYIYTNLVSPGEVASADINQVPSLGRIATALNRYLRRSGIYVYDEIVLHPTSREWVLVYARSGATDICVDKLLVSLRDYMCVLKNLNEGSASHSIKEGTVNDKEVENLEELKDTIQTMEGELCHLAGIDSQGLSNLVKSMSTTHAASASIMVRDPDGTGLLNFPSQIAVIDLEASADVMQESPPFSVEVLSYDPKSGRLFVRDTKGDKQYYALTPKAMRINPPHPGTILRVKESNDKPLPLSCVDIIATESPRQTRLVI